MADPGYALLMLPAANRVYAESSIELCKAELAIFDEAVLGGRLGSIDECLIGGVPYLTFGVEELSEADTRYLANISVGYALFRREGELLRPVESRSIDRLDDDIVTIQKYAGKTNELFTKLLLNVTIMASDFAAEMTERPLSVLDPLCGRGTTLNQALRYGYHAAGVDIDKRDFDAYTTFIKTWLKNKRLKHHAELGPVRRDHRQVARRLDITFGLDKDSYKAGDTRSLSVVNADTLDADQFLPKAEFDVIVTDAPYGVRHGAHAGGRPTPQRGPKELLADSLPVWSRLLRHGGALGLSWNTYVARRDDLATLLTDVGFEVCDTPAHRAFRHRVDQAIVRDVLVARKP
jgi:SAM-dependent methyltransferase